ncbi:hypothetical protein DL96DRAFT_1610104 [Flagelloscypha sp. PMI_526]|nr:hypothetical protein DL96DRAFT_1610104 [Flagelloscypha sp. PMI_526]
MSLMDVEHPTPIHFRGPGSDRLASLEASPCANPNSANVKSFPDNLPIDVGRIICEFAAEIDSRTASNLNMASRTLHHWVTPIHFRYLVMKYPSSLVRLQRLHIAKAVRVLVFKPSGWSSRGYKTMLQSDLDKALAILPNVTTISFPERMIFAVRIGRILPVVHVDWDLDQALSHLPHKRSRDEITHLFLTGPFDAGSGFLNFQALTHLHISLTSTPDTTLGRALDSAYVDDLLKTVPVDQLPSSLRICTIVEWAELVVSPPHPWAFVKLVLGITDPRIVFGVARPRCAWSQERIRASCALRDAVLFWPGPGAPQSSPKRDQSLKSLEGIWEAAENVMRRREDVSLRERIYEMMERSP